MMVNDERSSKGGCNWCGVHSSTGYFPTGIKSRTSCGDATRNMASKKPKPIIPLNASSKTTLQFSMDSYLFLAKCNASCLSSNKKA